MLKSIAFDHTATKMALERITLKAVSDTPGINNSNEVRGKQIRFLIAGNSFNTLHAKGGKIMMGATPTDEPSLKHNKRVLSPSASPYTVAHYGLGTLDILANTFNEPGTISINKGDVFIKVRKNGFIIEPVDIEGVEPTMVGQGPLKVFNISQQIIKVNKHVGSFSRQPPLRRPPFATKGAKTGREMKDIFKATKHSRRGSITGHASQFLVGFTFKNKNFIRRAINCAMCEKQEKQWMLNSLMEP